MKKASRELVSCLAYAEQDMGFPDAVGAPDVRAALSVMDSLPQLIWTVNNAGRLTYANPACLHFSGLSVEELSLRSLESLIHPDDYAAVRSAWHDPQGERDILRLEFRLGHHTGGHRRVRAHLQPLGAPEDGLLLGTATEVEDKYRSEVLQRVTLALSQSLSVRQLTEVVLSHAADALGAFSGYVALLSPDGAALELMGSVGYSPDFLRPWQRIGLEQELPVTHAVRGGAALLLTAREVRERYGRLTEHLQAATTGVAALPLRVPGRTLGTLALSFQAWRQLGGEERAFLEALADLCAQALERARLHALTRASEARYRSLVEAISQIVWTTSDLGEFAGEQSGWSAFTGQTTEELLGWGWLDAVHPDDRDLTRQAWAQALTARAPYEGQHRLRRFDGEYRCMQVRAVPVLEMNGSVREWVGLHYDVTDLVQAEAEVRELNSTLEQRVRQRTQELEHLNAELEAFTYSVSHDLQTPVRHILGFTGLLERGLKGKLDDKARRHLEAIKAATGQMSQLIGDLLQLSRLGRQTLSWKRLDLNALVSEAQAQAAPDTAGRQIEWRVHPLPEVWGDRALLGVALNNLLSNALKYTRPRGLAIIEVWAEQDGQETVVHVRDNGVGFDPRAQGRLFGTFQRLHSQEQFEGNGVGLANVRRAIHRHGGGVWARGEVDAGATFSFSLPGELPEA